jgi:hypothetical protein
MIGSLTFRLTRPRATSIASALRWASRRRNLRAQAQTKRSSLQYASDDNQLKELRALATGHRSVLGQPSGPYVVMRAPMCTAVDRRWGTAALEWIQLGIALTYA